MFNRCLSCLPCGQCLCIRDLSNSDPIKSDDKSSPCIDLKHIFQPLYMSLYMCIKKANIHKRLNRVNLDVILHIVQLLQSSTSL